MELKLEITTTMTSVYASVVGTLGFVFSAWNILRDRARVVVKFQKNMYVMGASQYNPKIPHISISVINRGRRPVRIEKVGVRIIGSSRGKWILYPDRLTGPIANRGVLTEENPSCDYLAEQVDSELAMVWFAFASDAKGVMYKRYLHRLPTFWVVWRYVFLTISSSRGKV
jgi:hypothetical protein